LGTGFIDDQRTTEKFLAVESCDRFVGFGVILNFGKTKNLAAGP